MSLREIGDIEAIVRSYHPTIIAKFNAILDAELSGDFTEAERLKSLLSPGEKTYYVVFLANSERVIPVQESPLQQIAAPILYTREASNRELRDYGDHTPPRSLNSSYERRTAQEPQYFGLKDKEPEDSKDSSKKDCRIM